MAGDAPTDLEKVAEARLGGHRHGGTDTKKLPARGGPQKSTVCAIDRELLRLVCVVLRLPTMRLLLASAIVASAVLVPATARPCSQAVGLFEHTPRTDVIWPSNAQLVIGVAPSSAMELAAWKHFDSDALPEPLDVVPLGPTHAIVLLDGVADLVSHIEVDMVDFEDVYETYVVDRVGEADRTPPTAPSAFTLEGEFRPRDVCFGSGIAFTAQFAASRDDVGVAAYYVYDILPNDAHEVVGAIIEDDRIDSDARALSFFVPERQAPPPGEERCYFLGAIDLAGNHSRPFGASACATFGAPPPQDAGVVVDAGAPRDGGTTMPPPRDGGAPLPDAGTVVDSGVGGPDLERPEQGCGCAATSGDPSRSGIALSVLLLMAATLARRREQPR